MLNKIILLLLFLYSLVETNGFYITKHPLENRIAYINGIKNINKLDKSVINDLQGIFKQHPMLIFKNCENIEPKEFIEFVKNFDENRDNEALENPEDNQDQMLQPFDQFPDCKHVAPRGNVELIDYYNIKNINIKPYDAFINNYLWHTDIVGHEYKLPNVITAFYIIEQPLIGGDTDFISGETIYENLSKEEQLAAQNILIETNRRKFITNSIKIDYAGCNRLEEFIEPVDSIYSGVGINMGNVQIPILFAPDPANIREKPRIIIMPTFFEKVVGWNVKESREWIRNFMNNKVLPHRVSIQWKKGDLAVFNNRRFIHSSTPARNYLDNQESNKRLLLQTFIPTNKPLLGIKPLETDVYACYNVKWINDLEKSIISAHNTIKFAISTSIKNNKPEVNTTQIDSIDNRYYILNKKPEKNP